MPFHIGDRVRLRTQHCSYGGWSRQLALEVGVIAQLIPGYALGSWSVDFPTHRDFYVRDRDIKLAEGHHNTDDVTLQRCEYCNAEVPKDEIQYDHNDVGICKSCVEKYSICDNCGGWTDNLCRCADYCPDCHEEYCHSGLIHEYHSSQHHHRLFLPNNKQDLYLGIELEMENGDDIEATAEALYPLSQDERIFTMEEDSSLYDGLEVISEPATLDYHKTTFGWQKILHTASDTRAISHESERCGLHIHFNVNFFDHTEEAIDLNSAKLLYFFERFWEPLIKFSRRTGTDWQAYAQRYGTITKQTPKEVCDYAKEYCGRHYVVNLTNTKTIEIRIFRGTLNEETFFACLEFVDFLARYVKKHTIAYIQQTSWKTVVKAIKDKEYPNLRKYLRRRELLSV